jgi:flagellar FliJ protein
MVRSQRLKPVVEFAAQRERQAARSFAEMQCAVAELEHKLDELLRYRREYQNRLHGEESGGISAATAQCSLAFIAQLDETIFQHRRRMEDITAQCRDARQQWLMRRVKVKALDQALQRRETEERHHAEQRAQRELDEHSQQSFFRRTRS